MKKSVSKAFLALTILTLAALSGCSELEGLMNGSSSRAPDSVRGAELGSEWRMDQMTVSVAAGSEALILLRLDYGDKVDGYFYVEKGRDTGFRITGNSPIYEASPEDEEDSSGVDSGRFTFRATEDEGNTYTLTFTNPRDTSITVFLEVIYPVGGSLFMPIERE